MENFYEKANGNGVVENGYHSSSPRHYNYQSGSIRTSLSWLDLRVFYVRVSKCEIDDSTPQHLTLNHVPLDRNTLLEVNGVRTSIYSDGVSTLLRRDRIDKKSEEVTFVSTDSCRMTGSVKFEVFDKDVLVLSGALELCNTNGFIGADSRNHDQSWSLNCESDALSGTGLLKGNQYMNIESGSPSIEVYVAGCFSGSPIILTKSLPLGHKRTQMRKAMLDSIPEYETTECQKDNSLSAFGMPITEQQNYKPEIEDYSHHYPGMEYLEGEDEELSWFNAGVRVGVGIGLSICVGLGVGVGLLVKTYQGTTRNFRRRLF
ncbi:hypothetical protein ACH5RR_022075 [Cinchona calisaya]|uniref:Erythronate-4-phosphate dehydrogenase family protein n=1 Tax=Cinchona calisaya TaxID=153742 RepID=A0ABD2Z6S8_9GENT